MRGAAHPIGRVREAFLWQSRNSGAAGPTVRTGKSLDGLYFMIGEEEKNIRQNPVATGNAILSKVFGTIR